MVHLYSRQMFDSDSDLSTPYSRKTTTYIDWQSPPAFSSPPLTTPSSEASEYPGSNGGDGLSITDTCLYTDSWPPTRDPTMIKEWDGEKSDYFIEHCASGQCIFGCGGHHTPLPK